MGIRLAALAASLAGAAALSGCVDDGYGYGGGYSAVSVGYSSPGYYGGYDDYGYGGYGGGYGSYYGWYGDYYYPGSGFYVYDRDRRPHRWNSGQRRYWETRRSNWRGPRENHNWGQFDRDRAGEQRRGQWQNRDEPYRRGTTDGQWRNAPQGRPDGAYRRGTGNGGQRWEGGRSTSGERGQGRRGRRD
ncbi:hypothetical protein AB2M62_12985 [Sphingomonas sp. MMS12-HWE2-04]|uniref:hypothetical protein n=1 Tax=Sphingomonas sp. MMS12-HWE2-04 TaxID=3234199 RepID=UPI00384F0471